MTKQELITAFETRLANATTFEARIRNMAILDELKDENSLVYSACEQDLREYINDNFNPGDIFDDDDIVDWVKDTHEMRDLYDDDDIMDYVKDNFDVDDFVDVRWH